MKQGHNNLRFQRSIKTFKNSSESVCSLLHPSDQWLIYSRHILETPNLPTISFTCEILKSLCPHWNLPPKIHSLMTLLLFRSHNLLSRSFFPAWVSAGAKNTSTTQSLHTHSGEKILSPACFSIDTIFKPLKFPWEWSDEGTRQVYRLLRLHSLNL